MAGVQAAHDRFGKLPFRRLFEPAIVLAEQGEVVSPVMGWWINSKKSVLSQLPETKSVFTKPDGKFYAQGDLFRQLELRVIGDDAESLPASSCFSSLVEASAFFEGGSLGYSVTHDGGRLDGLLLRKLDWRIRALAVTDVYSSYFADEQRFPAGSVEFDHALVMRDIIREWHKAEDLYAVSRAA